MSPRGSTEDLGPSAPAQGPTCTTSMSCSLGPGSVWAGAAVLLLPPCWPDVHPTKGPAPLLCTLADEAANLPIPSVCSSHGQGGKAALPLGPVHLQVSYPRRLEVAGGVPSLSLQHMTGGYHVGKQALSVNREGLGGWAKPRGGGACVAGAQHPQTSLTSSQGFRPVQCCQPQKH